MSPLSRQAFVRALRGLSRREFAAFVAALWAARGFETTVVGDVVVAERAGDRRRLGIHHGAGWLARFAPGPSPESVDAIVTSGAGTGVAGDVPTVGAGELREMALYAIDRAECGRLFRRHLGRSPSAHGDRAPPSASSVGAFAVLAIALVVLAGAGGFNTPAPPPSNTTLEADGTTTPAPTTEAGTPDPVEVTGFESAAALADAHTRAVEGRSRFWSLTFRAYRNGHLEKQKRQSVWIQDATVYRSTTEWWAREGIGPAYRGNATTYADGTVAYERFRERHATVYSRLPVDGRSPAFADQPAALVRRYLAVDGPRVVTATTIDGALGYRIVATGAILSNASRATTTAEVTRAGVVRSLRTEYDSFGGLRIVVTLRVDGVGATTARAPPWLERARNETGR